MARKAKRQLAADIRASLRELRDLVAGKPTKAIVHRVSRGRQQAAMKNRRIKVEIGSGNIFADLGLPNAEEHQLKAALVVQLHRFIKARKLTQVAAAKLIGIKQPDLSNILRGHFQGFSLERLMRMLTAFDQDVEITVRPRRGKSKEAGRITCNAVPAT
jgi:predicted XRE-type DNA-binding protein